MDNFTNKIAVVTGGGTGMGRELVRQLAKEGCHVAMCDVIEENMLETFEIVSGIHQGNVKYRGIDGECNENGCTDGLKSIYKDIQLINFGLGYKF